MAPLLQKRYRLMIEVEVTVADLTAAHAATILPESLGYTNADVDVAWFPDVVAREQRLLHALLADQARTERYLHARLGEAVGAVDAAALIALVGAVGADAAGAFAPVLDHLDPADQAWFQDAAARGAWQENTKLLRWSVQPHIVHVAVEDVSP